MLSRKKQQQVERNSHQITIHCRRTTEMLLYILSLLLLLWSVSSIVKCCKVGKKGRRTVDIFFFIIYIQTHTHTRSARSPKMSIHPTMKAARCCCRFHCAFSTVKLHDILCVCVCCYDFDRQICDSFFSIALGRFSLIISPMRHVNFFFPHTVHRFGFYATKFMWKKEWIS